MILRALDLDALKAAPLTREPFQHLVNFIDLSETPIDQQHVGRRHFTFAHVAVAAFQRRKIRSASKFGIL